MVKRKDKIQNKFKKVKKSIDKQMDWALVSLVVAWNLERAIFLPN